MSGEPAPKGVWRSMARIVPGRIALAVAFVSATRVLLGGEPFDPPWTSPPQPIAPYAFGGSMAPSQPTLQPNPFDAAPPIPYPQNPPPPAEILLDSPPPAAQLRVETNPDIPVDARPGVFQKLFFTTTWVAPGGEQSFGLTSFDAKAAFAVPAPSRNSPLIIAPGFNTYLLDGPAAFDVPSQLYVGYVQLRWMHRLNSRWSLDLALMPGIYSDFRGDTADGFRSPGYAALTLKLSEQLKLVGGAAYLDRHDITVLPVAGVVWKPRDDLVFELVAPKPRVAARIDWFGAVGEDVEDWVYVAGEFGGETWSVHRLDGNNQMLNYRDYRVLAGIERKVLFGLDGRLEVGYAFGRELEYESGETYSPSSGVLVRAGLVY